jgi:hypothetical protein
METFSTILFHAHSGLRYLILLAGVVTFIYSLAAAFRRNQWNRLGRILLASFVGLMDLQVLMGLGLILVRVFFPALWGHLTLMILAATTAHVALALNKRRTPEGQNHALAAAGAGIALLLIVGGILSIGRPLL